MVTTLAVMLCVVGADDILQGPVGLLPVKGDAPAAVASAVGALLHEELQRRQVQGGVKAGPAAAEDCADVACLVAAAEAAGLAAVVATRLTVQRAGSALSLAWIDVRRGGVLGRSVTALGQSDGAHAAAVNTALSELRARMASGGTAAAVADAGYEAACARSELDACYRLGVLRLTDAQHEPAARQAAARPLLETACAGGHASACLRLASLLQWGDEPQRAAAYNEQACQKGSAVGCLNLAMAYEVGRGVTADAGRAQRLYESACGLGEVQACGVAGVRRLNAGEATQAAVLLQRACDSSDASACHALGSLYADGRGVGRDGARAAALQLRACVLGDATACDEGHTATAEDD